MLQQQSSGFMARLIQPAPKYRLVCHGLFLNTPGFSAEVRLAITV
jgi:hypothetical protein